MSSEAPPPLIRVEDYAFRYPGTDEFVLDGATLAVDTDEFLAVLGGNGSGKTTLCKAFNGLVPHFFEGETEGKVVVDGVDTTEASVGELSRTVGYVYQDFENQLVQPTVRREVEFGPLNYGFDDYRERATRALERLGVGHLAEQFIWELSGGQKHLVAVAGVLALDPEVIVVDEPAAQLDPGNAERVYDVLADLRADGRGVVVIEHDTELVAEYADRVALVDDGAVRWTAPTPDALNRLDDLRERDIHPPAVTALGERLDVRIGGDENNSPDAGDEGRYPVTVDEAVDALADRPVTTPDGGARGVPSDGGGRDAAPDGDARDAPLDGDASVVDVEDVCYGYRSMGSGKQRVLDGLSLSVERGEKVALVGSNGAGKSTLLKLVTGLVRPDAGTVEVLGTDTAETAPERLADDVVYVHQQPEEMFIEDSVEKDVGYYLRQRGREDADAVVDEVVDYLDLGAFRSADGRLLSIGQQRRASLAIALAMEPSVVLLDEPTGCLDVESRREVEAMLDSVERRVDAVVVATHDLQFVASWADRVVVLDDGRIAADAPPAEALTDAAIGAAASMRPPQAVQVSRRLGIDPPATTIDALAERLGEPPERADGAGRKP
ncbi:ABC transporter ATP-binding protein [Halosimplex aquaticum]|uniref:ABC transporter ATP-binding protein n=1 Tax=Halosimplex aquaticum TaxID=3026162 RepID=A0ABD5Y5P0_9EURY|nr:ABC transporter ATP-binding protein [Halosimplex aquaticum]